MGAIDYLLTRVRVITAFEHLGGTLYNIRINLQIIQRILAYCAIATFQHLEETLDSNRFKTQILCRL